MYIETKLSKEVKKYLFILNQIFEIEKKAHKLQEKNSISRNTKKLKEFFEEGISGSISFIVEDPIHEKYSETRTDVEASISGEDSENLIIVEVIKPIIRIKSGKLNQIVQKAIVIVESK